MHRHTAYLVDTSRMSDFTRRRLARIGDGLRDPLEWISHGGASSVVWRARCMATSACVNAWGLLAIVRASLGALKLQCKSDVQYQHRIPTGGHFVAGEKTADKTCIVSTVSVDVASCETGIGD